MNRELSRRTLLHKAGLGLIAVGATSISTIIKPASTFAQAKEPPMPPTKRLGWAIVGLGKFATEQIIPSFAECKSSKLVAFVSGDKAKAEKYALSYGVNPKNIYNYQNYDSIRNNPEIDVIYIILPNGLHAEYTIRGLQAGKHLMCEKPMANTVQECQAMIDAAKKATRKLMIAYRAQYEPFNLAAIKYARSGQLGKLKLVTSDHGRNLDPKDPADRWRMNKKLAGGGSLYDIGIYSLQAARYITGEEPIEINAMIYSTPGDARFREVEENVNFGLRFPGGTLANCSCSYGHSDVKRFQVFGSDATLELDPATDYYRHRLIIKRKSGMEEPQIQEQNQFALEIDHFSQSIMENKQPKTPGEEGLQDVRLMNLIYEAARTGSTIKV
ncbi:glucose-fructose oxidoreductase [Calothrix sp. HK-06]|nr:glucose-fructose oxidoreductase [Calothrix sp. HK-06]